MIASLVLRGARLDPSQEAEIVVMLHLPDEARNGLDSTRDVVEIDDLVGRVGVPPRHPDADGRDASRLKWIVAASVDPLVRCVASCSGTPSPSAAWRR